MCLNHINQCFGSKFEAVYIIYNKTHTPNCVHNILQPGLKGAWPIFKTLFINFQFFPHVTHQSCASKEPDNHRKIHCQSMPARYIMNSK